MNDNTSLNYMQEVSELLGRINHRQIQNIARLLEIRRRNHGTIYIAGNGGSAANASHLACHLLDVGIRAVSLSDNSAFFSARANDVGYENAFSDRVRPILRAEDLLFVISCSAQSRNIMRALSDAKERGVTTIGLYGYFKDDAICFGLTDHAVILPSKNYGALEDVHSAIIHALKEMLIGKDKEFLTY